jgi:hypothetical protein
VCLVAKQVVSAEAEKKSTGKDIYFIVTEK